MSDKTSHPPLPEAFAKLGVAPAILRGLADARFEKPSDIQSLVIPPALAGKDILGQAKTGTGKTAAFAVPLIQEAEPGREYQAIILVPTRELCTQVVDEVEKFAKHTPIRAVAIYGGERITAQEKRLKHKPEILVGTPGRVMDMARRGLIHFEHVDFAVLDEVDRMLDIGFRDDIRKILGWIKERRSQDVFLQTIFVSATISREIESLARKFMRDDEVEKLIAPGADEDPTVEQVEQAYISADPWDKYKALRLLMKHEEPELAIVFVRTKRTAEKVAKRLGEDGFGVMEIHGNLAQNKREKAMKNFRGGKAGVLVATDVASRGIDVADISHIINYDIPDDPEAYVHRVGRTARMGAKGKAFTFVAKDQGDELTKIESLINMQIPNRRLEGFEASPPPRESREKPLYEIEKKPEPEEPTKPKRYAGKVARRRRR
jgi:ATP-dependent RNA helicase DeaD